MLTNYILIFCVTIESVYVIAGGNSAFREDYEFSDEINSHIKLHAYPRSWVNARTRCRHEGAELFTPANQEQADFVKSMFDSLSPSFIGIYLGLNAYFSEGDFASIEERSVLDLYNVWNDFEPNNLNDNEDCAVLTRTGKYSDVDCAQVYPFLCARAEAGLTWNADCNTYDTGYESSPGLTSCYKINTDPKNWTNAYATCKAEGGYLEILDTETEKNFVVTLYAKHPSALLTGNYWKDVLLIGFHDFFVAREYEYIHGGRVPTIKFYPGEPNDFPPGERCGAMYRNGYFDDIWCEKLHIFACERPLTTRTDRNRNAISPYQRGAGKAD